MRNGRYVLDKGDFESCGVDCADCAFTAGSGALYVNFDAFESVRKRVFNGGFRYHLSGVRRAFTAAFKTEFTCAAPTDCITLRVGNGNDCIIERSVDMRATFFNAF